MKGSRKVGLTAAQMVALMDNWWEYSKALLLAERWVA
jgi:hypothetical protein